MTMRTLQFTIEFTSDWHIGTGSGRHGHLDRTYARDSDGHPYVGAKALSSLLRDSLVEIAGGLDSGADGPWHDHVIDLLGSEPALSSGRDIQAPTPATLRVDTAVLAESVKASLRSAPVLVGQLAAERPGVALDEFGASRKDHLRFIEVAPAGLVLHSTVHLPADASDATVAFVAAGLANIRAVGAHRRRGLGRCSITVNNPMPALDLLLGAAPTSTAQSVASNSVALADAPSGDGRRYSIVVRTLSPVLLKRSVRGNAVDTHRTIPGSVLLAMLGSLAPSTTRQAVLAGRLSISEALPSVGGTRSLPSPLSLFRPKVQGAGSSHRYLNHAVASDEATQVKQLRGTYVVQAGGSWQSINPTTSTHTHNVIDDALQRPTTDTGGLFSNTAIAAGQEFTAELWLDTATELAMAGEGSAGSLADLLGGEHRIGTSKKDDYGRVVVELRAVRDTTPPTGSATSATIWLTSDALVADERQRLTPTIPAFIGALSAATGQTLRVRSMAFSRTVRHESWQGKWGLPRPSLTGLVAGTVVNVETADGAPVSLDALAALGSQGVGLRTGEGFGRFVVQHALLSSETVEIQTASPVTAAERNAPAPTGLDRELVQRLEARAWQSLIAERVAAAVASGVHSSQLGLTSGQPGMSQLGALRAVVRSSGDRLEPVSSWWEHLKATARRREKWSKRTVQLIDGLLAGSESPWKLLAIEASDAAAISGTRANAALDEWRARAVLALLAGFARAAQHDTSSTEVES